MEEIVATLHDYYDAKSNLKALRTDLIRLAVEYCNADQATIKDADVAAYLDGYLAGMGYLPKARRAA